MISSASLFRCRGPGTAWACQVNVGQRRGVPIAQALPSGTAGLQTSVAGSFVAAPSVPRPLVRRRSLNVCNRADIQAYFGDAARHGALCRFAGTERKHNEVPDYFVFVACAWRLLQHRSLCQRRWQRSHGGFQRLRRVGGSPCRPVVPSAQTDSTKIAPAIPPQQ
jgi:hypothetical protein